MLSYLTLNPENWHKHSYIAMNGVYENAVLTALKGHSNLSEIVICTDNDIGGIDAADRLKDILHENNYKNISRVLPQNKDFNEDLKQLKVVDFLPAVPHKIREEYHRQAENLQYLKCRPDKLAAQIYAAFKNNQYGYLAEYALAGSAFFLPKTQRLSDENRAFLRLQSKLRDDYRAYSDKGKTTHKMRELSDSVQGVMRDLKQTVRTREQSINTQNCCFSLRIMLSECLLRSIYDLPVVPIGYVQHRNPMWKRAAINKYTEKGRAEIHKSLKGIDMDILLYLMRNPIPNRSIEYNDNRISLYSGQMGKCAVTGKRLCINEIHCHHKVPVKHGGNDDYSNLKIVHADVHRLIHAVKNETIQQLLVKIKLTDYQLERVNALRKPCKLSEIMGL